MAVTAIKLEDGSLHIEWADKDSRYGFYLQPDLEQSGWFHVTNKATQSNGFLPVEVIKAIKEWLCQQ